MDSVWDANPRLTVPIINSRIWTVPSGYVELRYKLDLTIFVSGIGSVYTLKSVSLLYSVDEVVVNPATMFRYVD